MKYLKALGFVKTLTVSILTVTLASSCTSSLKVTTHSSEQANISQSESLQRQRGRQVVVFLIDKSASMKDCGQLESIKAELVPAMKQLLPNDLTKVIAFDYAPFLLSNLSAVKHNIPFVETGLAMLFTHGQSNVITGLQDATADLMAIGCHLRKKLILITDNKTPVDSNKTVCNLINTLKSKQIELTILGLGCKVNNSFAEMARSCGAKTQSLLPENLADALSKSLAD